MHHQDKTYIHVGDEEECNGQEVDTSCSINDDDKSMRFRTDEIMLSGNEHYDIFNLRVLLLVLFATIAGVVIGFNMANSHMGLGHNDNSKNVDEHVISNREHIDGPSIEPPGYNDETETEKNNEGDILFSSNDKSSPISYQNEKKYAEEFLRSHPEWKRSNYPENGAKVQQISLLGERNSGTNWVTSLLNSCFPTIPVNVHLVRWKHWFQDDIDDNVRLDTFVVHSVVNPYDWLELMRTVPRDMPNHMYMYSDQPPSRALSDRAGLIDWKTFVSRPWSMARPISDIDALQRNGTQDRYCQSSFRYLEVIPCLLSDRQMQREKQKLIKRYSLLKIGAIRPFPNIWTTLQFEPPHTKTGAVSPLYEMDRNNIGVPYNSIIDMRRDKLLNHMSVQSWEWVKGYALAPIEKMGDPEFVQAFLSEISSVVGIEATCTNLPKPTFSSKLDSVPAEFIEWVTNNTDWTTEALVGYSSIKI